MGRLVIAAFLMLVAGDNAIAGDQGPASAPASQLQTNPSNEPSQSLILACSGILTITAPGEQKSMKRTEVSDVSVILYSNSPNVFSNLFATGVPITSFKRDQVAFDVIKSFGNENNKYRITGGIGANGRAIFNEVLALNGKVRKISFWYLRCNEGAVPPPVDLTPARPPLIVPMTPPS